MRTCLRRTGLARDNGDGHRGALPRRDALRAEPAAVKPVDAAGSFLIPAYAFDRGNAKTFTHEYADAGPMIAFGGASPVVVAYDVDFPVAATYTIHVLYAAQEPRPVEISLDDKSLGTCCRDGHGQLEHQRREMGGVLHCGDRRGQAHAQAPARRQLPARRQPAVRLVRARLPKDWKLDRPKARTLDSPPPVSADLGTQYTDVKIPALRAAIEDLVDTFGPQYPGGQDFLRRLDALRERVRASGARGVANPRPRSPAKARDRRPGRAAPRGAAGQSAAGFRQAACWWSAARSSPSLGLPRNWQSNSCLPREGFDDEIAVLSPVGRTASWRRSSSPTAAGSSATWTCTSTPTGCSSRCPATTAAGRSSRSASTARGLRQLTGEQPDVDSYDACYLPDGRILFTSTALFRGRAVRVRQLARGEPLRHGRRRPEHPPALLRPGARLVPDGAEQRPRALPALGIHRHAALEHAAAVPHESRRHGADGVLRQQFLLAQLDLLRPADPRPSDEGRGA